MDKTYSVISLLFSRTPFYDYESIHFHPADFFVPGIERPGQSHVEKRIGMARVYLGVPYFVDSFEERLRRIEADEEDWYAAAKSACSEVDPRAIFRGGPGDPPAPNGSTH